MYELFQVVGEYLSLSVLLSTAQKMKFSIKHFFSKRKKSLLENLIFVHWNIAFSKTL